MHPDSEKRFTAAEQQILTYAAREFTFDVSSLKRLGSFENFVFEVEEATPRILRITSSDHRSVDEIRSELDWLHYLAEHDAPVSMPQSSVDGQIVESTRPIEDGDEYSIVIFDKAPGSRVSDDDWGPDFFRTWGRTIGRLHRITAGYEPSAGIRPRQHWHQDPDFHLFTDLDGDHDKVKERCAKLLEDFAKLPTPDDAYGLIHNDIHQGNFFVHNGSMTVFDFDDSLHDWLVNDLAIALYYALRDHRVDADDTAFARLYWDCLLEGYHKEHSLASEWFSRVPMFLKLREHLLYVILKIEAAEDLSDWCVRLMANRKERIENAVPVIDIDFSK